MTTLAALPHHLGLGHLRPDHFGHFGGPFAGGFGFLFLLIPLFWIGVVVLIVRLSTRRWRRAAWAGPGWAGQGWAGQGWAGPHYSAGSATSAAETTLAERFAQGDIDETEYRARLEVLRANAFPRQEAGPSAT